MRNRNRFDKDINHESFEEKRHKAYKDKYYIKMDKKQTLQEIFNEIGNLTDVDYGANDKGGKIHTYLETYDRLFEPFRNGCQFMEIGLAMGDSLKLWDRYFENSVIVGVDISIVFELPPKYKNDVYVIQADGTKEEVTMNTYDIIIDDSSHMTQDQIDIFNRYKHKMNKGGLYIIEDILALDQERERYLALHDNCEIIDMRSNGRFDNILIVYKF